MNINLFIASIVYAISYQLLTMILPAVRAAGFDSRGELVILQTVCIVLAYLAYYVRWPQTESKRLSTSMFLRFALATTVYVVTAYVALRYAPTISWRLQLGAEDLLTREILRVSGLWVVPYLAPPVMFLVTLWLTAHSRMSVFRQSFNSLLMALTLVTICFDIYLGTMLANDHSGWSGLIVIPMFILSAGLFLLDAIILIITGFRTPKDNRRLRYAYLTLGTTFGVVITVFALWVTGVLH